LIVIFRIFSLVFLSRLSADSISFSFPNQTVFQMLFIIILD